MVYSNRIKQQATGATHIFTLGAIEPSFVAFPDGETKFTLLAEDDQWLTGVATVTGSTLTVDTVEDNSNGDTGFIDFTGLALYIAQTITGLNMNDLNSHVANTEIHMLPGGSTGQVLTKLSIADYDTIWATPETGGGTPTGTNINIDMGTFPEPINASIDAGGFT